jgi:hypothetical protein
MATRCPKKASANSFTERGEVDAMGPWSFDLVKEEVDWLEMARGEERE